MSSQDGDGVSKSTGSRMRMRGLDVDLNVVPPSENEGLEEPSTHAMSQHRQDVIILPNEPIDLEAYDDDVIISSPRAFEEAKNNSRKHRGLTVVVDIDSEEMPALNNQRSCLSSQTNANSGIYIILEEDNSNSTPKRGWSRTLPPPTPPPPPPPPEPTFNCPICMGPLLEETSTKCGHIFCKVCITKAIAAQHKCPTCRVKITSKSIFRVYLPATNSS